MKNGMWRLYRGFSHLMACAALLAASPLLSSCSTQASAETPIKVAVNMPISGPIAAFCGNYPNALSMGLEEAAIKHNMPAHQFTLDIQDNAGKPGQAVAIVKKHLMSKPDVYVSGVSPMSLAIANDVSAANIPHLFVAFDAFICRGHANRLRMLPHFKIEGPVYVEYAKKRHAKKVFIISNNLSAYNDEFSKIVEPALRQAGISFQREVFEFDAKDYRSIAMKAAAYKPDLIMVAGFSVHIYPIIGALRNYDLVKDGNVISTMDFVDMFYNKTPLSDLKNVAFITPGYELSTNADPIVKAWKERFQKRFRRQPGYVEAYAYDTGCILVEAKKRSGSISDRTIRAILPYHGVSGDINIDKDGDLNSHLSVAEIKSSGRIETIL
jgi:ABC-type branched-subunit amino acid transport system substrate-binding protein